MKRISLDLCALTTSLVSLTGCGLAPSVDILGSFFPAWLLCWIVAIGLTAISWAVLKRYVQVAWPVMVYPSLTALFAFGLWLSLFR